MPEPRANLERILAAHSDQIERHLSSLSEAQRALEEIVAGRSLLLVDTTLGNPLNLIKSGLEKMKARGWEELAQLYIQKLFGGRLPENSARLFQDLLGERIKLVHRDIREDELPPSSPSEIAAVLFSGSPANVSEALSQPDKEVKPGITHGGVFTRATELYRRAAEERLPVIGICYGHQMISTGQGGSIIHDEQHARIGHERIEPTQYGVELFSGVIGGELPTGGIAAFHGESVVPNHEHSAVILHTSDREPAIVHGLLHVSEGSFKGKAQADTALVSSLLEDARHVALTVQGHPEYTGAERLITFAIKEDEKVFDESRGHIVTADMLSMFTRFLAHHGAFKK